MKTVEDYRRDCLTILGDAGGRRYSASMLDMGLREALGAYRMFCPRKETVKQRVSAAEGWTVTLPGFLDPGVSILTIRNEAGFWLEFAEYRTETNVYLNCYGNQNLPAVGEMLTLELSCPHFIRDLDGAQNTTVPDAHALTVCTGAAGYAMRIRARSVTEVFGKRPEDREALSSQANRLLADYLRDLGQLQPAALDPLPRGEFPV